MQGDAPIQLDQTDWRIVRCLSEDATLSNNDLAERVGITAAPLSRRLARLYEKGVIRQTLIVDPVVAGVTLQAFLEITLDRSVAEVGERFIARVTRMPEVLECHAIAGNFDFLLKVAVGNIADYKNLIWSQFDKIADIRTIRSHILLDSPKRLVCAIPGA